MQQRSPLARSLVAAASLTTIVALSLSGCGGDSDDPEAGGAAGGGAGKGSVDRPDTSAADTSDGPGPTNAEPGDGDVVGSGEFTLLSYNVAGLPELLSGSEPAVNMPQIGPKLNAFDLVLLQETWKTPDPNPVAPTRVYHEELEARVDFEHRSTPADQPLGTDPSRPEALLADGLNRFSRFAFGEVTRVRWDGCYGGADQSQGGAGDCLSLKGFSVATTTLADGVEVDVYNLHGEAGSTPDDQRLQADDFEQLAAFVESHSAGRAIILAGDTNLHTDTTPDPDHPEGNGDLAIWEQFLERTGLTDVCGPLACTDADKIDKAAFRDGDGVRFEPISREWATDEFVRDDGEPLSDHPPLVVRFSWTATSG